MAIPPEEERILSFFFGADRMFWQSPLGAQLEHAASARRDSSGRALGSARSWHWNLPDPRTGEQRPPPTFVSHAAKHGGSGSGGYEVSPDRMLLFSRASSRALTLWRNRSTRLAYAVLLAYYGDRGCRWAAQSQDRYELGPDGKRLLRDGRDVLTWHGLGPGAIAAVYPFTAAGAELLRWEAAQSLRQADKGRVKPGKVHHLSPALLAAARQQKKKKPPRPSPESVATARRRELETTLHTCETALHTLEEHVRRATTHVDQLVEQAARARALGEHRQARALTSDAARAREARQEPVLALAEAQRTADLLRRELGWRGLPPTLPSPLPEDEDRVLLDERAELQDAHTLLLDAWRDACAAARAAGRDLPPEPPPPVLPPVPVLRLPTLYQPAPPPHRHPDEQLQVALVVERTQSNPHRRKLLTLAREQAETLLCAAWSAWLRTRPPRGRPLPPVHAALARPLLQEPA